MSQNRKRSFENGNSYNADANRRYGDTQGKRPRQEQRGPAEIGSYFSTIRSVNQLSQRLHSDLHLLILDEIDVKNNEDFVLDRNSQTCALELVQCSFRSSGELPRDLLLFLSSVTTLQDVKFLGTHLDSQQWSSIVHHIAQNSSIRSVSISSDSLKVDALLPLIHTYRLEYLQLGDVKLEKELLRELLCTKNLKTLELKRPDIPPSCFDSILSEIHGKDVMVAQFIITEEQPSDTTLQWTKFDAPILKAQLAPSLSNSETLIICQESKEDVVLHTIGCSTSDAASRPKLMKQVATAFHRLPPGVLAVVPSSSLHSSLSPLVSQNPSSSSRFESSEAAPSVSSTLPSSTSSNSDVAFKFGTHKAKLIVVEFPVLTPNKSLREMVDSEVMPLLFSCLHQLQDNGHLVLVDVVNYFRSNAHADLKEYVDMVWSEAEKRMCAFFNTERVGCWLSSRAMKRRINILSTHAGSVDTSPLYAVDGDLVPGLSSVWSSSPILPKMWCWKKVATSLSVEYGRFLLSHELYSAFNVHSLTFSQRRDIQAILEQWFMLRANGEDGDRYPIQELVSKRMCSEKEAESWVSYITSIAMRPPPTPLHLSAQRIDLPQEHDHPLVTMLKYGVFSEKLQRSRVDSLLSAAIRRGSLHPLDDLLIMAMRYGTVFGNFRQYCTNEKLFQELVDSGVHCEGFASPFNAQILICRPPDMKSVPNPQQQWDPTFCSCFQDSDAIFGSLGSFFQQTFDGMHVFLNPPTVDSVLTKTMRYIHEQMESYPCKFHVLLPAWEDLLAYQLGTTSPLLVRNRTIDSNTYPSQNPYSGESHPSGKKFILLSFESKLWKQMHP